MTEEIFENEEVQAKIERRPSSIIHMEIFASPILLKKARKKAIKSVAKEVEIPGFRKGKAPDDIIVKKYFDHVEQRWQKQIADASFLAVQKLHPIPTLNQNTSINYDLKDHNLETGAHMTFSFETEPLIPTIDVEKFSLNPVKRKDIGEKEIQEYLRQVQLMYATWTEITERPVKEGDFVLLDLVSLEDNKEIFSQTRFEVTEEKMADWMKDLIIGQNSGSVLEGVSKPNQDASEEEKKQFSEKKVRVTIKKIEEPKTLELNDDFARGINFPSIEEFKKYAEELLNNKADQEQQQGERKQVNDFLIQNYPIDLPLSLIEAEMHYRKKEHLSNPSYKSKYEQFSSEEKKAWEETLRKECIESVSLFFLSRKMCQQANISIKYEDVEKHSKLLLSQAGIGRGDITDEVKALALSRFLLKKTQDYILEEGKKLDPSSTSNL